jgi:hypothetical protein
VAFLLPRSGTGAEAAAQFSCDRHFELVGQLAVLAKAPSPHPKVYL